MRGLLLLLGLQAALLPAAALAQSVAVDEGTFALTLGGAEAGTETFSIRRIGVGADRRIIAQGRVELNLPGGRVTLEPALEVTESLSLAGYQNRITGAREEIFTLAGTSDRRFQGRTVSPRGEQVQEYRAASGTILAEDWVAHHYVFLGTRIDGVAGTIPVIVPGEGRQLQLQFTPEGNETIVIGGAPLEAQKFRIEIGDRSRRVWFDDRGRVLRVEDPVSGYRAERTQRPG